MQLIHTTLVIILFQVLQCVELKDLNWESLMLKSLSEKTLKEYLKNEDFVHDYVGFGGQPEDLRREEIEDEKNGENIFELQPNRNVPLLKNDAKRVVPLLLGYNTHIPLFGRRTPFSSTSPLMNDVKSEHRKSPDFNDNIGRVPNWQSLQTSKLPPILNDLNLPTKKVIFDTNENKFNKNPIISYYKNPFRKAKGEIDEHIDNTEKNKSEDSEERTKETEEESYEDRTKEDEDNDATEETEEDSSEVLEFPKMKEKNYKEIKKYKLKGKKITRVCPSNGFFPDLKACNKFYLCLKNEVIHFKCTKKTFIYNPFAQNCIPYFKDTCKNFYCKKKGNRKVAYERNGQYYASCKNEVAKRIHKCPTGYIFVERDQKCENILPLSGITSKPIRLPTLHPTPEMVAVPFTTKIPHTHIQRSSIKPNNGVKLSTISINEFVNNSTSYSPTRPATLTEMPVHLYYGTSKSSAPSNPLILSDLTYSPIIQTPTNSPFEGSNISVNNPIDPSISQWNSFNDKKNTDENTEPNWTKWIERFNEKNINIQTTPSSASTSYHKLSSNVKDNFPNKTQKFTTQYFQSSSNEKLTVMPKLNDEVSNTVRTPGLLEIQEVFRSKSPINYISKTPTPKAFDATSEVMGYSPFETVTLPSIVKDDNDSNGNLSAITITPHTHISTGSPSVDLALEREQTASQFEANNVSKSNDGSTSLSDSNGTTQLPLTSLNPIPQGNKTDLFPTTVEKFIMNYFTTIRHNVNSDIIASDTDNQSLELTTSSPDSDLLVDENPVAAQKISTSRVNDSTNPIHVPTEGSERSDSDNFRVSSTISKSTDESPSPNTEPTTSGTEISFSSDRYPSSHVPLNRLALNKSTVANTEPTDESSRLSDNNRTSNTEPAVNVLEIPTPSVSIPSFTNVSLIGSVENLTSVTITSGDLPSISTSTNEPKLPLSPLTSTTLSNPSSNDTSSNTSVTVIPDPNSSIPASTAEPRKSVHNNTSITELLKHNETSEIPNSTENIVLTTDMSLNDLLHNSTEPPTTITDMPSITASIDSVNDLSSRDLFHNRTSTTEKPVSVIIILTSTDFLHGGSGHINYNSQQPTSVTEIHSTSNSPVEATIYNKATTASPVFEVGEDTNSSKTVLIATPTPILPYTTISNSAKTENSNISSNSTFVAHSYEVSKENSLEPNTQKPSTTTETINAYLSTISSTEIPIVGRSSFISNYNSSTPTSFQSNDESKHPSTNSMNASAINVNLNKTENTHNASYTYTIPSETESSTRSFSTVIHTTYVAANSKTSENPIIQQTTEPTIRKNLTSSEYLQKNQTNNSVESSVSNLNSSPQTTTDSVFESTRVPEMSTSDTVQYNSENSTSNNLNLNLTVKTSNSLKDITKPQGHISITATEKTYTTKEKTIANFNITEYNSSESNYSLSQHSTSPIQPNGKRIQNSTEQLLTNNSYTTPSLKQSILNKTIDDVTTVRDSLEINTGNSTSTPTLLLNMATHHATDFTYTKKPNVTFPSYGKIYQSSTISPNTEQYLGNNTMVIFELPASTEQNPASRATAIMTDEVPFSTTTHLPPTTDQNSNSSSTNDQIYGSVQQVDVLTTSAAPTFVAPDSEVPITNQTATESSFSNVSPNPSSVSFSTENKVQDSSIHVDLTSSNIIPNVQSSTVADLPFESSIKTNSTVTSRIIANSTSETKITSTESAMSSENPLTNLKTVAYNNSSPSSEVLKETSKMLPDPVKSSESFLVNLTGSKPATDILSTMPSIYNTERSSSVIDNSTNKPSEVISRITEVNTINSSLYTSPSLQISKLPVTNTTDRATSQKQIHRTTRDTSKLSTQSYTVEGNLSPFPHITKNTLQPSSKTLNKNRTSLTINQLATNVTVEDEFDYNTPPSAILEINEQSTVGFNTIQFSTEPSYSTEAPSVINSVSYSTNLSEKSSMTSINNSADKTTYNHSSSTTSRPNPTVVSSFASTSQSPTAPSYSTESTFVSHNDTIFTTINSVSSTDKHKKSLAESSTDKESNKHLNSTTFIVNSYFSNEQGTSTESSFSTIRTPLNNSLFNYTDSPMIISDSSTDYTNNNQESTTQSLHSNTVQSQTPTTDPPISLENPSHSTKNTGDLTVIKNNTFASTTISSSHSSAISTMNEKPEEYLTSDSTTSEPKEQTLHSNIVQSQTPTADPPISLENPSHSTKSTGDITVIKNNTFASTITSPSHSSSISAMNKKPEEYLTSDSTTSGPKEQSLHSNTVMSQTPTTDAPISLENPSRSTNSTVSFPVIKNNTFSTTTTSPTHSPSISAMTEKPKEYLTSGSTTSEPKEQTLHSNTVQSQTLTTDPPISLENPSHSTKSTGDLTVIKNNTFSTTTISSSHSSAISTMNEKTKEYLTSGSTTSEPKEQTLHSNTVQSQTPTTDAPISLENLSHSTKSTGNLTVIKNNTFASTNTSPSHSSSISAMNEKPEEYLTSDLTTSKPKEQTLNSNTLHSQTPTTDAPISLENPSRSTNSTVSFPVIKNNTFSSTTTRPTHSSSISAITENPKEYLTSDLTTSKPKEQTLNSNTLHSQTPTTDAPISLENPSRSTNSTVSFPVIKNNTFSSTTTRPTHSSSISAITENPKEYLTSDSTTFEPKEQTLHSNTVQSQTPTTDAPISLENLSHSTKSTGNLTVIKNNTFASTTTSPSHSSSISAMNEKPEEYLTSDLTTSEPKEQTLNSNTVQSQTPTTDAPISLENPSHSTNSTVSFPVIKNNTFSSTTTRPTHSSSISAITENPKEYLTSDSTTFEPKEQTLHSNTVQSQTPTTDAPISLENLSHSTKSTGNLTVIKNNTFASTTTSPSHSSSISAMNEKPEEYLTSDLTTSEPKEQTLNSNTVQSQTPTADAPISLENQSNSTNSTRDLTVIQNNTFASTTSSPRHSSSISAINEKSEEYLISDSTTVESFEEATHSSTIQQNLITTDGQVTVDNLDNFSNSYAYNTIDQLNEMNFTNIQENHNATDSVISATPTFAESNVIVAPISSNTTNNFQDFKNNSTDNSNNSASNSMISTIEFVSTENLISPPTSYSSDEKSSTDVALQTNTVRSASKSDDPIIYSDISTLGYVNDTDNPTILSTTLPSSVISNNSVTYAISSSTSIKPSDQESAPYVIPDSTEYPSTTTLISATGISSVEIPNNSTTIIVESKTLLSTTSSFEKPTGARESNSSTNTPQTLSNITPNTNGGKFGTTEIVINPTITVATPSTPVAAYLTSESHQESSLGITHQDRTEAEPTTNSGLNKRNSSEDLDQIINHTIAQDTVSSRSIPDSTTDGVLTSSQNVTYLTSTTVLPSDILTLSHDNKTTDDPTTTTMKTTTSGATTPSATTNKADEVLNVLLDSLNFFFL